MRAFFYPAILSLALPVFGAPPTPSEPSTTWLGATDEWTDESNWSDGVPSESTSAVFRIQAGETSTIANINGDTYVKDLYFYDGFSLGSKGNYIIFIKDGGSMNISGDLYYSNLRIVNWGGLCLDAAGGKLLIDGDATFAASKLTEEQEIVYDNAGVEVQIGRAASTNPMLSEISIGGDLTLIGGGTGVYAQNTKVSICAETVNIGGVVNLVKSDSTFTVVRAALNNPEYNSTQKWGGLKGTGIVFIEGASWSGNAKYNSAFNADITLTNKADQTFTGEVKYGNINDGGFTNTTEIHLTLDAENASATQTINLGGSKSFTTVSVKNGTLIYSAPAAAESLTVSGGTLLLSHSDTTQGDLTISGGSFGATMDNGSAKVKSLTYSGGKFVFATEGIYGGLPNSIAVEGKFSKDTLEKIVIDFSGLDAETLIGEPAMTLITAGSFEGMSTSVDADEYFAAENLINAIADFAWNGNSLTVAFAQVPEPAALAAVFGALALALAARRRGK